MEVCQAIIDHEDNPLNFCSRKTKNGHWEVVMDKGDENSDNQFWRVRWSKKNYKGEQLYAAHYGGNGSAMNRAMAENTARDWNEKGKLPVI